MSRSLGVELFSCPRAVNEQMSKIIFFYILAKLTFFIPMTRTCKNVLKNWNPLQCQKIPVIYWIIAWSKKLSLVVIFKTGSFNLSLLHDFSPLLHLPWLSPFVVRRFIFSANSEACHFSYGWSCFLYIVSGIKLAYFRLLTAINVLVRLIKSSKSELRLRDSLRCRRKRGRGKGTKTRGRREGK